MTAKKMNFFKRAFVSEKVIKGAVFLGPMDEHHAAQANPNLFPSAVKKN
jgi:hypothetical protein